MIDLEVIQQKIKNEASASAKGNAAIQMRWPAIKEKDIPQELLQDLNTQKAACEKIIKAKNELIQELNLELRNKDEEYINALLKQEKDMDLLMLRMREQTETVIKEYERHFDNIELTFEQERKELLKKNDEVIEELKQKRRRLLMTER